MTILDNEMLWRQFGAAIEMLGDALRDCARAWDSRRKDPRRGCPDRPGLRRLVLVLLVRESHKKFAAGKYMIYNINNVQFSGYNHQICLVM